MFKIESHEHGSAMRPRLAIVMAAGKGTRMKSDLPKVLVPVGGRAMIEYVLDTLAQSEISKAVVVVGYRANDVRAALSTRRGLAFVDQVPQHGTGHAVMVCREHFSNHEGPVIVLAGDSPMLRSESLARLLAEYDRDRPACLLGSADKADPGQLGRVVRDSKGRFQGIVEHKDADAEQRRITEVNLSCYVFDGPALAWALDHIDCDNAQQEYYLTDCPGVLLRGGYDVRALCVLQPSEALSINTLEELGEVESELASRASANTKG